MKSGRGRKEMERWGANVEKCHGHKLYRWWSKVSGDRMISPRGTAVIFLYSHTAERFMCPEVREIERKKR